MGLGLLTEFATGIPFGFTNQIRTRRTSHAPRDFPSWLQRHKGPVSRKNYCCESIARMLSVAITSFKSEDCTHNVLLYPLDLMAYIPFLSVTRWLTLSANLASCTHASRLGTSTYDLDRSKVVQRNPACIINTVPSLANLDCGGQHFSLSSVLVEIPFRDFLQCV